MGASSGNSTWDAIVIGSGMGGLSCAAALARNGHRVLVLEQFSAVGGQSGMFRRNGFAWDVGMHYLGGFGEGSSAAELLDWLAEGHIEMAPVGPVYDTLHFPDGFEIGFSRPEAALKMDLKDKFPAAEAQIDAYFAALHEAAQAMQAVFALRALPAPMAAAYGWWKRNQIGKWCGRTTRTVIDEIIDDPKLAAVLSAQWPDYGAIPCAGSFGIHAMVVSSFFDGAFYPVGGAKVFAQRLVPVIERAGGQVMANTAAAALLVENGETRGVLTTVGAEYRAQSVVSDIGARETVGKLLPLELRESDWVREILSLHPNLCHFSLYVGFEGDIHAAGATAANHWLYATWDTDAGIWEDPVHQSTPPAVFVSFPSLKDPGHRPGERNQHTGQIIAFTTWNAVSKWAEQAPGERGAEYAAFKAKVENSLLKTFAARFPALAPLIIFHELATPLATAGITGHGQGGFYGLETTPRRILSHALGAKTPLPGLYLAGQDVATPGIMGALYGGLLAAAAIDPHVLRQLS
jgi:all-trans-retinol 13,14-reductase